MKMADLDIYFFSISIGGNGVSGLTANSQVDVIESCGTRVEALHGAVTH